MSIREFLWPDLNRVGFLLLSAVIFLLPSRMGEAVQPMYWIYLFWVLQAYVVGCFMLSRKDRRRFLVFLAAILLPAAVYFLSPPAETGGQCQLVECFGEACQPAIFCNILVYKLMDFIYLIFLMISPLTYAVMWLLDKRKKKQ